MNQDKLIEKCRLTDEEIHEYLKDPEVRGYPIKSGWVTDEIFEHIKDVLEAQLRKAIPIIEANWRQILRDTITMKDTECQARVEEIKNLFEVATVVPKYIEGYWWLLISEANWQVLKKLWQTLKEEL